MGAAGLREVLVRAPETGGPELAAKTDAMAVRTTTAKAAGLASSDAEVTRLRLGLEGSWAVRFEGGAALTPSLEIGARSDGGDAETGYGADLGGGIAWSDPERGLSAEFQGRDLLTGRLWVCQRDGAPTVAYFGADGAFHNCSLRRDKTGYRYCRPCGSMAAADLTRRTRPMNSAR